MQVEDEGLAAPRRHDGERIASTGKRIERAGLCLMQLMVADERRTQGILELGGGKRLPTLARLVE